jgi:hypothetical protein
MVAEHARVRHQPEMTLILALQSARKAGQSRKKGRNLLEDSPPGSGQCKRASFEKPAANRFLDFTNL